MSDYVKINEILYPKTKLKDLIRMVWHNTANKDKDLGAAAKVASLKLPKPPTGSRSNKPKKMKGSSRQLPLHFGKPESSPTKQLDLPFDKPLEQEPPKEEKPPKPTKLHKQAETEPEPKLQKPKVLSTLFSKKLDMSQPPFYQDPDKWYAENFKREDSQGYTYSVRYIGPTLDKFIYVFSKYPHENNVRSFNDFYADREKNMHIWNIMVKQLAKKKWPNDFGGMNEQIKLQK